MTSTWLTGTVLTAALATTGIYSCASHQQQAATPISSDLEENPTDKLTERPEATTSKGGRQAQKSSVASKPAPLGAVDTPLPESLRAGTPTEFALEGDRPLRITHAKASQNRAIVYLHGMCGNPKGADPWADLAANRGTLIVVRATVPCPDRPGYKWPKDIGLIQRRIDSALAFVKEQRGGALDTNVLTLIGYSQGANRAEKLAARSPSRYPFIVLGGPPTAPTPELLHSPQHVAILGGELEDSTHMRAGALALHDAGVDSRFFLLPRAHHGGYGPEGRRVIMEVFDFLGREH